VGLVQSAAKAGRTNSPSDRPPEWAALQLRCDAENGKDDLGKVRGRIEERLGQRTDILLRRAASAVVYASRIRAA
jgi:hypothetical protein